MKCEDCVEWGSEFCKDCLKEEAPAMNTGAIPNPADTVQGPKKKEKKPKVIRRFKSYMDAVK